MHYFLRAEGPLNISLGQRPRKGQDKAIRGLKARSIQAAGSPFPRQVAEMRVSGSRFPACFVIALFLTISLAAGVSVARDKKPPRRLLFPSKAGEITFDHQAHAKRERNACTECHDGLWPRSAKVPIKSSAGCKTCHRADGKSFGMEGNCARCHGTKGATDPKRGR